MQGYFYKGLGLWGSPKIRGTTSRAQGLGFWGWGVS